MNPTVTPQELALVIAIRDFNPTVLNPDFLRFSGILPSDWQLAQQPVYSEQAAQFVFQNGIAIAAQRDRVMFMESIANKPDTEVQVAAIAQKFASVLHHADYQAFGINLKGYVACKDSADEARTYLTQTLMVAGPWQEYGQEPVRAALTFSYALEQGQFMLSVNEAMMQISEQAAMPVVLFSGNFSYDLSEKTEGDRLQSLLNVIHNWQNDLDAYRDLINTKFLVNATQSETQLPELIAVK